MRNEPEIRNRPLRAVRTPREPDRQDVLRMLYHVVTQYQGWRSSGFVPNELLDSTFKQAQRFLADCAWWPTSDGRQEATNGE
jgi:hypothetical protein